MPGTATEYARAGNGVIVWWLRRRIGMNAHDIAPIRVCRRDELLAEVSFADSSLQYCPTCQTGGKPLADRRMSKLLK